MPNGAHCSKRQQMAKPVSIGVSNFNQGHLDEINWLVAG
jgi:diketogulonate reductase-like aldo/keto reductase